MTNGEKIKEIFPSVQITECESYIQVMGENFEFNNTYSKRWWNAEYKEPTIKNGISNKSIIYKAKESKKIQEDLDKLSELNKTATKNDLGVDCISRQAAIDAIRRIHPIDTDYDCTLFDKVDVMYVLNDLPSVTPIRPKGHWIDREVYDADRWKCSECGRTEQYQENFCPNCGADMREVEE